MTENASVSSTEKKKRGRPPKNVVVETNSVSGESREFNSYQSYQSMKASSCYYFGLNLLDYYKPEQLAALVKDPMANNDILREISLMLYGTNGIYTNTVDYMTAMPTLDKVIVTHGKSNDKKRKNKELMGSTLRTIKDKEIVRDALWRGMIEGIAFYYFETTGRPQNLQKTLSDYDVDSIVEINEFGITQVLFPYQPIIQK